MDSYGALHCRTPPDDSIPYISGTGKDRAMRFGDFFLKMDRLSNELFCETMGRLQNPIWRSETGSSLSVEQYAVNRL